MLEIVEPVSGTNLHKPLSPKIWLPVLVILTAAVGYLSWSESLSSPNYESGIINYGSPSTGSRTNDLEDWQTYRNPEYGFEVKYPGSWKFNKCVIYFVHESPPTIPNECFGFGPYVGHLDEIVEITVTGGGFSSAESMALGKGGQKTEIVSRKNYLTDGIAWLKIEIKNGITGEISFTAYLTERKDITYSFGTSYGYDDLANQILSTFKFIK